MKFPNFAVHEKVGAQRKRQIFLTVVVMPLLSQGSFYWRKRPLFILFFLDRNLAKETETMGKFTCNAFEHIFYFIISFFLLFKPSYLLFSFFISLMLSKYIVAMPANLNWQRKLLFSISDARANMLVQIWSYFPRFLLYNCV